MEQAQFAAAMLAVKACSVEQSYVLLSRYRLDADSDGIDDYGEVSEGSSKGE